MAKYQVLKRKAASMKMENNLLVEGEMVEYVQIPDEGVSQVQVYFVPKGVSDDAVLGVAAVLHETELKKQGIGFTGPQAEMNGVVSEPEEVVTVDEKGKRVSVEEVKSEK